MQEQAKMRYRKIGSVEDIEQYKILLLRKALLKNEKVKIIFEMKYIVDQSKLIINEDCKTTNRMFWNFIKALQENK